MMSRPLSDLMLKRGHITFAYEVGKMKGKIFIFTGIELIATHAPE